MRRLVALWLGMVLVLGLPGIGRAQSSVQVQGTIQAVDCKAQTVVLNGPGTSNTITAAAYTAVLVNSMNVPFCSLRQYLGAPATAWLVATGSEFVATRIDLRAAVVSPPAVPVAPPPAYYPYYGYSYPYYAYPYCFPYSVSVYYPYCYPYAGPFFGVGFEFVIGPGFHRRGRH